MVVSILYFRFFFRCTLFLVVFPHISLASPTSVYLSLPPSISVEILLSTSSSLWLLFTSYSHDECTNVVKIYNDQMNFCYRCDVLFVNTVHRDSLVVLFLHCICDKFIMRAERIGVDAASFLFIPPTSLFLPFAHQSTVFIATVCSTYEINAYTNEQNPLYRINSCCVTCMISRENSQILNV